VHSYVSLLAICSIQFWLGLRLRNFIAPIGIGIALWFTGMLLVLQFKSSVVAYLPYSLHAYGTFPKYNPELHSVVWISVVYSAAFLFLAYASFKKIGMSK
jgi:hypothetical protein